MSVVEDDVQQERRESDECCGRPEKPPEQCVDGGTGPEDERDVEDEECRRRWQGAVHDLARNHPRQPRRVIRAVERSIEIVEILEERAVDPRIEVARRIKHGGIEYPVEEPDTCCDESDRRRSA